MAGSGAISWSGFTLPGGGSFEAYLDDDDHLGPGEPTANHPETGAAAQVQTGLTATSATFGGLANGATYFWHVVAKDFSGGVVGASPTLKFVATSVPTGPSALAQSRTTGGSPIPVGGWTTELQVDLSATGDDPDPGDTFKIQFEVRPVGTPFTSPSAVVVDNVAFFETAFSLSNASQALTRPAIPVPDGSLIHWQARTVDVNGIGSAWVGFGGNIENPPASPADLDFGVDMTAPVPGTVADGGGTDIDFQTSTTTIGANWPGFADPQSGIVQFDWAVGTTPGASNVQSFISVGLSSNATNTGLTLTPGQIYYVTVRATNAAGLFTAVTSDGVTVDNSPPVAGLVNDGTGADIDTQLSATSISANWTGFSDPESLITGHEWSIGTTPGGADIQPFTAVGLAGNASNTGLSLSVGTPYFVTVRATNGTGATISAFSDGVTVVAPLSLATASLPNGTQGAAYTSSVSATGGSTPYTFSVTAGSLPNGLSLNASTGAVSGTPSAGGSFSFTVQVSDNQAPPATASQNLSVLVNPPLAITTTSLPSASMTSPYSAAVAATGGQAPYAFSIVTGALPAGLSLNASSGAVTGTATAPGPASFTVQVTDSTPAGAASDTQALTIDVVSIAPPGSVAAIAGNGQVDLSWDPVAGAASYKVHYGPAAGTYTGTSALQGSSPLMGLVLNAVTLTGFPNGVTHHFAVSSVDAGGNGGPLSADVAATPDAGATRTQTNAVIPGSRAEDYRLMTWPVNPPDPDPLAALGPGLGAYGNTSWRMFRWNPGTLEYEETGLQPAGTHRIEPGAGYWLISIGGGTLALAGTTADASGPFTITLQPGWNMVGHPWSFPVDVSACGADGVPFLDPSNLMTRQDVWDFAGSYVSVGQLVNGRAYWIKNLTTGPVTLTVPPLATAAAKPVVGPLAAAKPVGAEEFLRANPGADLPPPPPAGGVSQPPALVSGGGGGGGGCFAGADAPAAFGAVLFTLLLAVAVVASRRA
jgi:hypothetical protein